MPNIDKNRSPYRSLNPNICLLHYALPPHPTPYPQPKKPPQMQWLLQHRIGYCSYSNR